MNMGHRELSLAARKAALLHALSTYCVPGTATGTGDPALDTGRHKSPTWEGKTSEQKYSD